MKTNQQRQNLDVESRAMIYQGVSVNQLAAIFEMRPTEVLNKLAGVNPAGVSSHGNPIYKIKDAAPRLVKIPITAEMIEQYMRRANPRDYPAASNKMFWDGMMQQARYREQAGELWHSSDVVAVAGDVFQSLRMSLLLIPDMLLSEAGLNDRQMRLCQNVIDSALEETRAKLIDDLQKPGRQRSGPDAQDGEL